MESFRRESLLGRFSSYFGELFAKVSVFALLFLLSIGGVVRGEMVNLSTRGYVGTGDNIMIAGFIVDSTEKVIVRALAPSLADYPHFVPGTLADPYVTLYDGSGVIVQENDNWETCACAQELRDLGLAPDHSLEAALVATLEPGAYTAFVKGMGANPEGIAIVEILKEQVGPKDGYWYGNVIGGGTIYFDVYLTNITYLSIYALPVTCTNCDDFTNNYTMFDELSIPIFAGEFEYTKTYTDGEVLTWKGTFTSPTSAEGTIEVNPVILAGTECTCVVNKMSWTASW
jgi:hypothetical protein